MARIDDIERRLQNWARWKHGACSGGLGFGRGSWAMEPLGARYREAVIPTNECEAADTDKAIGTLQLELQHTLHQVYLTPASPRIDAQVLGVSEAGVKARIYLAHRKLSAWFVDKQASAEAERERVEKLARAAVR